MLSDEKETILKAIAELPESVLAQLPVDFENKTIYQSAGLIKHIEKRHPECLDYMNKISEIISNPDYCGVNPNENNPSCELIKIFDDNVQIGIKLDTKMDYLYIATLHTITQAKLEKRIASNRLKAVKKSSIDKPE